MKNLTAIQSIIVSVFIAIGTLVIMYGDLS